MENEEKKVKPPKYIMHDGYLYKRVPTKEIKEAVAKYNELSSMVQVISASKQIN